MAGRKKGSMTVEACIFFPVIIIASVLLAFIIKICLMQIVLVNSFYDAVHISSVSAEAVAKHDVKDSLEKNGLDIDRFTVETFMWNRSFLSDDFSKVSCMYEAETDVPLGFAEYVLIKNSFVTRKWTGISKSGEKYGFDMMCHDGSGRQVYIFPKDGRRYHGSVCRYVKARYEKLGYSASLENKYHMCAACLDEKPDTGETVYVFQYGGSYHDGSCAAVKKQTVCMSEEDAIFKGYSPCNVCGGV